MSKLEHMSVEDAQKYLDSADQRLFTSVKDSLTIAPVSPFHQRIIDFKFKTFFVILIFLVGIGFIGGSFAVVASDPGVAFGSTRIALIILGVIFIVGSLLLFFFFNNITAKAKAGVKFDQVGVYKRFFDAHFDNFEVERFATKDEVQDFVTIRPTGVPGDANISQLFPGAVGTIGGMNFASAWTVWHWSRTYSTGKTTHTQHYYFQVLGARVVGIAERYQNFELRMHYPQAALLNFSKGKLENEQFNKMASITSNDEIGLRRLLTPYTQEMLIKANAIEQRSTDILIGRNQFIIIAKEPSPIFDVNFDFSNNRDAIVASIVKDLKSDISRFTAIMSRVTTFKTLKTG